MVDTTTNFPSLSRKIAEKLKILGASLDLEYKGLYLMILLAEELRTPIFLAPMARAKGLGSEANTGSVKVYKELLNIQVRK